MSQRRLAVNHGSNIDACPHEVVSWQGLQYRKTVADLKLVLVVPQAREVPDRIGTERSAGILLFAFAGFGVLLTFAGVLLWTTYSYGAFLENLRQQHYSRPQVQYSDIRDLGSRP